MGTQGSKDDKQREATQAAQGAQSPQGGMQRGRESGQTEQNWLLKIRLPKAQPEHVRRIPISTQGGEEGGSPPESGQRAA